MNIFFQNCNFLIKTVEETGSIVREIRDLEDQVLLTLVKGYYFNQLNVMNYRTNLNVIACPPV